MADFAQAEFALEVREADGYSVREHLTSAWRQSGVQPDQLKNKPELPRDFEYLWRWFLQLHRSRDYTQGSPLGLKFREIQAWSTQMRIKLEPWELNIFMAMDTAFFKTLKKPEKDKSNG